MEDAAAKRETEEEEKLDPRKELLGGFVIYGVLALCAAMSLIPAIFSGGLPLPALSLPEGGLRSRMWGDSRLMKPSAVVVSFFAFDEELSHRQLAELTALRIRYPDEKLSIIAACTAYNNRPEIVKSFAERIKAPFPIIPCPDKMAAHIVGGGMLPITVVRDGEGNPVRIFRSLATAQEIAATVKQLLGDLEERQIPLRPETSI